MFKTRLDSYGNDFGFVWNFGKFLIFLKIFEDSTLHGTLGKKIFEKKYPKTCSKHVWTFLGTILGFSAILKSFWFFWKFSTTRPSKEHWAKIFFRKNRLKTCSTHVWTLLGTISAFLQFLKIFDILKLFDNSTLQGTLGKKKLFRKNRPKTYSKHVWTLLGTIVDIFGILKVFLICLKIFEDSTFHRTLGKKTFEKITPKYVQNTFGQLWERFWVCLEFWKIFDFFWKFSKTRPSMEHWAKNFSKKIPQNMFKTRLDIFGNDFRLFCNFEKFSIFLKIFEDSTLHGTLGKNFSKKIPQNMFKTRLDIFGNDFRLFCNFEKFSIFLKIFEDSTHQGTLGKKIFRNNYPETCSKHVWTFLGTILGFSAILKSFWFFWKFSTTRPSKEHWAKNFFSEKSPQNMFNTRLDTFGNDFGHFCNF